MFFTDSSDMKFGTFLQYVFHNMINEIGSKNTNKIVDNHFGTEGVLLLWLSTDFLYIFLGHGNACFL